MSIALDAADKKILQLLQKDATLTHQQISDRIDISATSVWRRIKNLEEVGVITARVALLDPQKVGMQVCALINIRLVRHGDESRIDFEEFIAGRPEVMECYAVIGEYDYALMVRVPNVETYEKFLTSCLLSNENVAASNSSFTLRQVKYTTAQILDL